MADVPKTRRRFQFTLMQTLIAVTALALVTWGGREIYHAIYPPLPSVEEWMSAQVWGTNHQKRATQEAGGRTSLRNARPATLS